MLLMLTAKKGQVYFRYTQFFLTEQEVPLSDDILGFEKVVFTAVCEGLPLCVKAQKVRKLGGSKALHLLLLFLGCSRANHPPKHMVSLGVV